jgi:hypothetical protein
VLTGFSPGPGPTADAVTALASDLSGDGPPLSRDAISDAAAGAWYPPKTAAGRDRRPVAAYSGAHVVQPVTTWPSWHDRRPTTTVR